MSTDGNFALRLQCAICGGSLFVGDVDPWSPGWTCVACGSERMRLVKVSAYEERSYSTYCTRGCATHLCAPGHCWLQSADPEAVDGD